MTAIAAFFLGAMVGVILAVWILYWEIGPQRPADREDHVTGNTTSSNEGEW